MGSAYVLTSGGLSYEAQSDVGLCSVVVFVVVHSEAQRALVAKPLGEKKLAQLPTVALPVTSAWSKWTEGEGREAMTKPHTTEPLARRLVADVALEVRLKPNRWVMLGDIVPKLGVSWEEPETAAQFAAAKPREWIEHKTHSLMLRQAGRKMLEEPTRS
jgi:hypothetical protein